MDTVESRLQRSMNLSRSIERLERSRDALEALLQQSSVPESYRQNIRNDLISVEAEIGRLRAEVPTSEAMDAWKQMDEFDLYQHQGGEAEARIVQNRQKMREPGRMGLAARVAPYATPEQKRKIYPWTEIGGLDVPLEYLIP